MWLVNSPCEVCYLENSDNGPEQGVKVLPIWNRVPRLCFDAELTAKDVHPENAATQQHTNTHCPLILVI